MGIASLIMAVIGLLGSVLMVVVALATRETFQDTTDIAGTPFSYLLRYWELALALLTICGIVFGIGGVRQANRKHSLAIAGLCMNLTVCFVIVLIIAGGAVADATTVSKNDASTDPGRHPDVVTFAVCAGCVMAGVLIAKVRKRTRGAARRKIGMIQTAGLVICPRCSKPLPRWSRFCRRCGSNLVAAGYDADESALSRS